MSIIIFLLMHVKSYNFEYEHMCYSLSVTVLVPRRVLCTKCMFFELLHVVCQELWEILSPWGCT